jgi:hypothetical protein
MPRKVFALAFERVLGLEYFDGPMAGVGYCLNGETYYVRIVGWDEAHLERLFALAAIPRDLADRVWGVFEAVETPRFPVWYPQSDGLGDVRAAVNSVMHDVRVEVGRGEFQGLLQSRDLRNDVVYTELSKNESDALRRVVDAEELVELKSAAPLEEFLRRVNS